MMKTTKKLKNTTPKSNGPLTEPSKQPAVKAASPKIQSARPAPPKLAESKVETAKPAIVKTEAPKPIQTRFEPAPVPVIKNDEPKRAPVKAEPVNRVQIHLDKPGAKSVCVAGSFNGWNPARTPLTDSGNGNWVGELTGVTGRHEYLFVVDGQWLQDPNAKETVQNPFGGWNSVLVVSA